MARKTLTDEEKAENKRKREAAKAAASAESGAPATTTQKSHATALLDAMKFCAPGYKKESEIYSQCGLISGGYLTTYDGILTFGHPIPEPITCAPDFAQLRSALTATAAHAQSITLLDNERLSIRGGRMKATVECTGDLALVVRMPPDAPVGALDSRMREGFEVMKQIASKSGEYVLFSSVLIRNQSMVATDGKIIAEFYHGIGFPTLTVPANFIEAVLRVPKSIVSFGFSERSLTFWFDDHSYVRTQLYTEHLDDRIDTVLPTDFSRMLGVPDGFMLALDQLEPFADSYVIAEKDVLKTHDGDNVGCIVEVPGVIECELYGLDLKRLYALRDRITWFDYWTDPGKMTFYGENLRGTVTMFRFPAEEAAPRLPPVEAVQAQPPAPPPPPPPAPVAPSLPPPPEPVPDAPVQAQAPAPVHVKNFPIGCTVRVGNHSGVVAMHVSPYDLQFEYAPGRLMSSSTTGMVREDVAAAAFVPPAPVEDMTGPGNAPPRPTHYYDEDTGEMVPYPQEAPLAPAPAPAAPAGFGAPPPPAGR